MQLKGEREREREREERERVYRKLYTLSIEMVVSGPKGVRYIYLMINIIHLLYSQKFSLVINFTEPSNLALQKGLNFHPRGKDHQRLYAIINTGQKKLLGKKFTHKSNFVQLEMCVFMHMPSKAVQSCAKLCSTCYIDSMLKYQFV